jgi:hypothetical protein
VGELGVSSDEDLSPEPSWSGDVASAAVDWSDMSGLSSSSPPATPECRCRDSRRQPRATRLWAQAHDKQLALPERSSGWSALVRRPADGRPSVAEIRTLPSRTPRRSKERSASARQLYDDSDRPDSDSLQRRRSRGKSSDSASTPSAPQAVDSDAAPRRLHLLLIRGGGAPDVHVSLVAGGGQGPTPAVAEAGGSASERVGVRVAAIEAAD